MTIDVVWAGTQWSCTPVTAPDPEPSPFRVLAYSQRDSRWRYARMGGTPQTVGGMGCALVSATSVLSQRRPDLTPGDVNAFFKAVVGLIFVNVTVVQMCCVRML